MTYPGSTSPGRSPRLASLPSLLLLPCVTRHQLMLPCQRDQVGTVQRFPTWMWRNTDVDAFIRWLRRHNEGGAPEEMAGFYGLDLYNLGGSMRAVIDYLDDVDPEAAAVARERYGCLMPYAKNPQGSGRMAITRGFAECRSEEHTSE